MFEPKFKVRIKHYRDEYYLVQYANYKFFKTWKSIIYWFHAGHPNRGLNEWDIRLFLIHDAEMFANSLKSMDDVEQWLKTQSQIKKDWEAEEVEYLKHNIPYDTKVIK